jgi:hypothetical protein
VTLPRQGAICGSLIHNQLHILHTTTKVGMEVSGNGGVGDLVLLVRRVLGIGDV